MPPRFAEGIETLVSVVDFSTSLALLEVNAVLSVFLSAGMYRDRVSVVADHRAGTGGVGGGVGRACGSGAGRPATTRGAECIGQRGVGWMGGRLGKGRAGVRDEEQSSWASMNHVTQALGRRWDDPQIGYLQ